MRRLGCAAIAILVLAGCASAPNARTEAISIDHMVIPAAAETGGPVAAYAGFDNAGPSDRLLGIACECAGSVELHTVVRDGEQMRMTNSFPLQLPTGRTEVKPPGVPLHFMLIDTTRPFAVGDQVTMQLRFEKAGQREVVFTVVGKSADGWNAWSPD